MTREEGLQQFAEKETKGLYLDKHNLIMMVKAGAKWADSHPHWIPVEERLPKADGRYIIADKYGGVEQMNFDAESKYWWLRGTGKMSDFVTHWMPLPKAPRKEE